MQPAGHTGYWCDAFVIATTLPGAFLMSPSYTGCLKRVNKSQSFPNLDMELGCQTPDPQRRQEAIHPQQRKADSLPPPQPRAVTVLQSQKKGLCQGTGGEQRNCSTLDEVTRGAAEIGDGLLEAKWLTLACTTSVQSSPGPTPRWAAERERPVKGGKKLCCFSIRTCLTESQLAPGARLHTALSH